MSKIILEIDQPFCNVKYKTAGVSNNNSDHHYYIIETEQEMIINGVHGNELELVFIGAAENIAFQQAIKNINKEMSPPEIPTVTGNERITLNAITKYCKESVKHLKRIEQILEKK